MRRTPRFLAHWGLLFAVLVGNLGCRTSGRPEDAEARNIAGRYLEALRAGDCHGAFSLTRVAVDTGQSVALFDEAAFLPVCRARKLVDYDLSRFRGVRVGTAGVVSARLRYEDGDVRTTIEVEDGSVLAAVKKITLMPESGPMFDPRIDGVQVAREQKRGCPGLCMVQIHDVYVFVGPHTLSVAGSRWTEPAEHPLAADATTVEIVPVLTPAASKAATQTAQRWKPECLPGGGCPGSPCIVDGKTTPPTSITPTSNPHPQNNGVFGPTFGLNVVVPARAACRSGATDVNVVVTLPHDGEPAVGPVLPV